MQARLDDEASYPSPLIAWGSVFILLLMTVLSHVDRTIISLMVDPIKASLNISDTEFSLLQGLAFMLFYAFASLPMGWLADRYSRHWVIYLGVTGWSICTALCGMAGNFWQLFTARLGVGCGEATLSPASYALLGDVFPRNRVATAAGVLAAGAAIGGALAFAIGGIAVQWAETVPPVFGLQPWQLVFVVVGLPGLFLAPLIFLVPRGHRATSTDAAALAAAQPYLPWLRKNMGFFLPMFVGIGSNAGMALGGSSWMPAYLTRNHGMAPGEIGLMLGLVTGIPGVIGFAAGGWLIDRMQARGIPDPHFRYFIVASAITTICGILTFVIPGSLQTRMVFWGIMSLCLPLTGPAIGFIQQTTPAQFRARTSALMFMIMYLMGMGLGPMAVAVASDKLFGGPMHIGAGITLIFAIFGPLTVLCYFIALRPARDALEASRSQIGNAAPANG